VRTHPHRSLTLKLIGLTIAMFGFGYVLVPLYDAFCALTGLGGRTPNVAEAVVEEPDESRMVRMEFVSSISPMAPFEFAPESSHLDIHPGQLYTVYFSALNLMDQPLTAQAVPSVTPGLAAQYLKKVACFCFTPQPFAAHEARRLPVVFMVTPQLPRYLDTLTLAYTLYRAPDSGDSQG
jgi:cytochrome c oxidase assembly protein subunit 11